MDSTKMRKQYGLWNSPITPTSLARSSGFSDLMWDSSGALVWLENRADRGVLVVQPADGQAPRDLNSDYAVRGRLGYGGGAFTVAGGRVYFSDARSGRFYCQPLVAGAAQPLLPAFGSAAAPRVSPDGQWLLFVHSYEDQDSIALVDANSGAWPVKLTSGHDFYMQPAWHPDGQRIAFIAWDHPNMPWDATRLYLGRLILGPAGQASLQTCESIAGGDEISIFQPEFSPDGRYLAYASDQTGWWQLYLFELSSGQVRQLTFAEAEHGLPAWVQGLRTYCFSPDGQAIYFVRSLEGVDSLWRMDLHSGYEQPIVLDQPYQSLSQVAVAPDGQRLAFIASAGDIPSRVVTCDLQGKTRVWKRATSEDLPVTAYARPQPLKWPGMDGELAYGLFFAPHNEAYEGKGLPPLIVNVHGGPTGQRTAAFNAPAQFFTSRGYAYLEVNYRGSAGYGRTYRNKLRLNWGIYDVQDSVSAARYLADQGRVDGERMVILGGSAGGFTVLKALEDFPGVFRAGICLYGIANQFTALDTHKFEAHYSDSLLGELPEAAAVYRERSPIFFADQIRDAVAIFQGEDDPVVKRDQSDDIVAALRRRNVPHIYHLYAGEGHGFRKVETIEHFYQTVEKFLQQYVLFA